MTAQLPDRLSNRHPRVDFGSLHLYGVQVGNIFSDLGRKPYRFACSPDSSFAGWCSANWKGYLAEYWLLESGELLLKRFIYPPYGDPLPHTIQALSVLRPISSRMPAQEVDEALVGNFYLDLREEFSGDGIYVPFWDGKVIEDRSYWMPRGRLSLGLFGSTAVPHADRIERPDDLKTQLEVHLDLLRREIEGQICSNWKEGSPERLSFTSRLESTAEGTPPGRELLRALEDIAHDLMRKIGEELNRTMQTERERSDAEFQSLWKQFSDAESKCAACHGGEFRVLSGMAICRSCGKSYVLGDLKELDIHAGD